MKDSLKYLVEQMRIRDSEAFSEFYKMTHRKVFYISYSILHDKMKSEDIVQETYMKFLDKIHEFNNKNPLAYLLTMARNLSLNEYQKRKREIFVDDQVEFDMNADVLQDLEIQAEVRDLVERGLSVLTEFEKYVFLLYTLEGYKHREIALLVSKPLGTITWTYNNALKKIKSKIEEESK